jgi:hypothetical protein
MDLLLSALDLEDCFSVKIVKQLSNKELQQLKHFQEQEPCISVLIFSDNSFQDLFTFQIQLGLTTKTSSKIVD